MYHRYLALTMRIDFWVLPAKAHGKPVTALDPNRYLCARVLS